jgi:serine/threonine protein phosphatase PrpC
MTLALRYAVRSDVGLLREGNEDSAYAGPHLLAVADGMGGYEAGEVASAAVISTVAPLDRKEMRESELVEALSSAVVTAKQALRRIVESDPSVGSMGTTLTAMLWAGGSAALCHIGDSRAYVLRNGDLYQITRDHTFVQALIDQGRLKPEEAATHPQRSLLLRALDGRTDADPDLTKVDAEVGDRYQICSDGLPVAVSDKLILQALTDVADPNDAVLKLIDLAIAGGGPDNITCIVADVIDPDDGRALPTKAPLVAGAAASATSSGVHDTRTKPFAKPIINDDGGMTQLGTVPATARASHGGRTPRGRVSERDRTTTPGRSRSEPDKVAAPAPSRAAAGEGEEGGRRARRRWPLMTSILALFVLLVAGGLFAGYEYTQSQFYVGTHNGRVAIFRGLNQPFFGFSLSSVYATTDIPVSGLPRTDAQGIARSSTGSLAQAQKFVGNLHKAYQACQDAYTAVRVWEAGKPKPVTKTVKRNGRMVTRTITPPYRPEPKIPAGCPPMHASGASG